MADLEVAPTTESTSYAQDIVSKMRTGEISNSDEGEDDFDDEYVVHAGQPDVDEEPESEPKVEEATAETPQTEAAPAKAEVKELEYFFTDEHGKRQSAKVDLNNHELLKKELSMARGARKWQVERDRANTQLKEIEPKYKDLQNSFDLINRAYDDHGLSGVINLLTGDPQGYSKLEQQIISKAEFRKSATPEQIEKLDLTEKLEQEARKSAKLLKDIADREEAAKKAAEEADARKTEAIVHPVFNEVRFAGKLNDPELEDQLDATIWQQGIKKLEALGDDTVLTKELVESTFKKIADSFNRVIKTQTEAKVNEEIKQKKVEAQTKVAGVVKKSTQASTTDDELRKDILSGNIVSAFIKGLGKR